MSADYDLLIVGARPPGLAAGSPPHPPYSLERRIPDWLEARLRQH